MSHTLKTKSAEEKLKLFKKYKVTLNNQYKLDDDGKYVLTSEQINDVVEKMIDVKENETTKIVKARIKGRFVDIVVYEDIIDLEAMSQSSRRKVVGKYIKLIFACSNIKTIDGKTIGIKSRGGVGKMHFNEKQKIALFAGDMVQIGVPTLVVKDVRKTKVKWHYYDSYIAFDNKVFYGNINIKEANGDFSFYDINKIKEVEVTSALNKQGDSNLNNNITNSNE